MATVTEANGNTASAELVVDDTPVSPMNKTAMAPSLQPNNALESLNMRADPDAQATVTDYLDFTEYLPADVNRSLTLIGKLDQTYIDASTLVHELTSTWGKLPTLPADQRPVPVQLRADISDNLNQAVNSRISSYAEAHRMAEYVNRHVNRARTILTKLQHMRDNYPTEDQRSPIQTRSPQMNRTPKVTLRLDKDGNKIPRPPRITVPGEVLAPYEIDFNAYSSSSDESSEEEIESPPRNTPAPRIKLVKNSKVSKQPKPPRAPRQVLPDGLPIPSTSSALAKLRPPPDDAVLGGPDLPWLQLTPYELAKLRKRMKKNAVWNPSDTMIARELKLVGRGIEAYKEAMQKAKDEGKPFEAALPTPVTDAVSGVQHTPVGAISTDALGADEIKLSNRGMKLNEAKKLKREQMAKQAVEEAEESARRMKAQARSFWTQEGSPSVAGSVTEAAPISQPTNQSQAQTPSQTKVSSKSKAKKRKRDSVSEGNAPEEKPETKDHEVSQPLQQTQQSQPAPSTQQPALPTQPAQPAQPTQVTQPAQPTQPAQSAQPAQPTQSTQPQLKRTKTETPIPPPQLTPRPTSVPPPVATPVPPPQISHATPVQITSATPVPVPVPPSSQASIAADKPTPSPSAGTSPVPLPPPTVTTTVPTKPPAGAPVPAPPKTSTTPIPPPTNFGKRETRKEAQKNLQPIATNIKQPSTSRQTTPVTTPAAPEQASMNLRRPASRGKASSVEPPITLAADRPRRASTARNTPAPELRQPSKRIKRPAPGVVNPTSGGTSATSAVGKRTAAPRKRQRTKKGTQAEQEVEVEVDDEGNIIDPDEARYCLCNRVSFGTMIQCDNVDNCKQEWFHLECVGLTEIPARTTKWYCPDCRVLLNIGGRGEVTSRGVKM